MKVFFCFVLAAPALLGAKDPITVDAVLNATSGRHGPITWAPDGRRFIVNERGILSLYEVPTGHSRDIIALSKLDEAAVPPPPAASYQWTDRRVGEHNVQWFADGRRLLVAANGDLFIVDLNKGTFEALTHTPEIEADPKLSPDNRYVSFRRDSDLYTIEVSSKTVKRLTTDGTDTLLNGELDWVYPEELDLGTAHWWSPDSRFIAYMQFDVSHEPLFPQVSLLNPRAVLEPERYPQPGDPNADVRVGIVPVDGGPTRWMDLGETRGYLLARVAWSPSSRAVMAERLNRVQDRLDLLMANIETGASRVVLHEEDPYWINVQGDPHFLGNDRFLWASERSGFRHLYICGVDGTDCRQLTSGDWEVDDVAVDERHNRVFFTSTEASPVERQIYSISLDGTGKQRLSKTSGTHAMSLAPGGDYYLDDFSSLRTPPSSTIFRADGNPERKFREPDNKVSEKYDILPTEIVTITASDKDRTILYARLIRPEGFTPEKKYPAVVTVYGGPGVQSVVDAWPGLSSEQILAHKGYVIWQLDNRGSIGRGHKFESVIYHNMGANELSDQKVGIDYLVKQGIADPARIGLYGWSYGGYMTLYTVTGAPKLIKAAVSGAPVTHWRNYDTIYTERYMGLPDEDAQGYKVSAPVNRADGLGDTKLLILHNIEDDNVHFQNSMQMAEALEKAGKQFDMVVYPQRTHHVSGAEDKQLVERLIAFFEENLK